MGFYVPTHLKDGKACEVRMYAENLWIMHTKFNEAATIILKSIRLKLVRKVNSMIQQVVRKGHAVDTAVQQRSCWQRRHQRKLQNGRIDDSDCG